MCAVLWACGAFAFAVFVVVVVVVVGALALRISLAGCRGTASTCMCRNLPILARWLSGDGQRLQ